MNRLETLLQLWHDQSISAGEVAELKGLLVAPQARAELAADLFLTAVLVEALQTGAAARDLRPAPADSTRSAAREIIGRRDGVPVRWWVGAVLLLLVAAGIGWLGISQTAEDFAHFETVQGETFIVSNQQQRPAQAGQVLVAGQGIVTQGNQSEAVVNIRDSARLKLGGDTHVTAGRAEQGPRVVLEHGDLLVDFTQFVNSKMTVETPAGLTVADAEQTTLHVSDATGVIVARGHAIYTHKANGKSIRLHKGEYVAATRAGDLYSARVFSGNANVWAELPKTGIDVSAVSYGLSFSPDGQLLAVVDRISPDVLRVGSPAGELPLLELRGRKSIAFTTDSRLLAAADCADVRLFNVASGQPERILAGNPRRSNWIRCLAVSPESRTIAVARESGELQVLAADSGLPLATIRQSGERINALAFSANGRLLAWGGMDGATVLWDTQANKERDVIRAGSNAVVWALAFSPDNESLAIGAGPRDFRLREPAGEIKIWDISGQSLRTTLLGHTRAVTSVAFSADGRKLVSGSADTTVRFWNSAAGREIGMLIGHKAAVGFESLVVALSPDDKLVATASKDNTVKVWKVSWLVGDDGSRL